MIRPAFTEVGIFLIPFAVYALFLVATRSGLLAQDSWPLHVIAKLAVGAMVLVVASFVLLAHFSIGADEFDLHSGPCRERQVRPRSGQMTDARVLDDAPWLQIGSRRARARPAERRRRGGARGRRRGSQRAARASGRRHRYRDHGAASRSGPPRQGRHIKSVPTGIEHGTVTLVVDGAAVRGHHLARGHRDFRPQGQGGVRPRLGARRRAARFHHQRPVGRCRRRRA